MDKKTERAFEILKLKVKEVGYAQVAVALQYSDTEAIKKWIYRKKMPGTAALLIITLWGSDENS